MTLLPPLRLTGATILRDGVLQQRSIALADGRLTSGPLPAVDLSGYYILPGIVDLHGAGAEHHLVRHPSARYPAPDGLVQVDREAARSGITTCFLTQYWSWEGGARAPEAALNLLAALEQAGPSLATDIRLQIRAETHLIDAGPDLIRAAAHHRLSYVIFNDHLPRALEMAREDAAGFQLWARRMGHSPATLLAAAKDAFARAREVPRHLCRLAEAFDAAGVVYGSHGDADGETRERYSMIGARITEFPATRRAAAAARAMMSPIVLPAPALLTSEGAAPDLAAEGLCDAIASHRQFASPARAAFALSDRGVMDLPRAWALISSRPAEILRMPDRGVIAPGKRADLVVIHAASRRIEATISGGRLSHLSGEAARRFSLHLGSLRQAAE